MDKSTKLFLGLAAGIALAAVVTLLVAPDEVKKYQKKAAKKGKKLWQETKELASDIAHKSADLGEEIKDSVTELASKVVNEGKELLS